MPLRIQHNHWRDIALFLVILALAGCSAIPTSPPASDAPASDAIPSRQAAVPKTSKNNHPVLPPAGSGRGGYYMDDGPGDTIPEGLLDMPDPVPQVEPYGRQGNRPYMVFGKRYVPITDDRPFKQRGVGSWYGKKFHGQKTSSGELYDMYKMTAAHPTLPLPSYARVTNLANGRQVIVRVNDRGPFHSSRIIDLSYVAALKLGYLGKGSTQLEVERLLPDDIARIASGKREQAARAEQTAPQAAPDAAPVAESMQRQQGNVAPARVPAKADEASAVTPSSVENPQPAADAAKPVPVSAGVSDAAIAPATAPGFYIQLGAYAQAGNAEAVRAQLMQNWASTLPPIEMVEYSRFYRLHSGPFATRAEAASAALRLQNAASAKPVIVQR